MALKGFRVKVNINIQNPMMQRLSVAEMKTMDLLKTVKHESLWSVAIENVIAGGDVWKFRRLVCDLKSQAADTPPLMEKILGPAALKAVQDL